MMAFPAVIKICFFMISLLTFLFSKIMFPSSDNLKPEVIKDIEAGKVNCVIVKDLSRFGRDYIETGRYLERIFPALGVRKHSTFI